MKLPFKLQLNSERPKNCSQAFNNTEVFQRDVWASSKAFGTGILGVEM